MSEVTPRLETRSAQPALIQRHVVPMAEVAQAMQAALPAAFGACQANGLTIAGPPLTRYPEMAGQTCTLEAGIPITERGDAPDGLDVIETTGGEVAVFVHKGSYQTLGHTWSKAFAWVKENGRELSGTPRGSYLTDPGQVPDPSDWVTEVCLPLA